MWLNLSYKNSIITLSFLKNFPSTKTNQTNQLLRDIIFQLFNLANINCFGNNILNMVIYY